MAVNYLVNNVGSYIAFGLSSDTKPLTMPDNAVFIETDTAKIYSSASNVWSESVNPTYSSWPTVVGNALKYLRVNAGETNVEWVTVSGAGDLLASNNLSDVDNVATARTNLGLDTTANQTDSADKRFMSDAQDTKLDAVVLPTGTPDGTKYLRDDNTWQAVSGGSGLTQPQVMARISIGF